MPWKPDLAPSSSIVLAGCFIGPWVCLPNGIFHQSMPILYTGVTLFGLIRDVLPIFSQVPVLLNQEPDSCFAWQTQASGCPELPPLVDGGGRVHLCSFRSENFLIISLCIYKWKILSIIWKDNLRQIDADLCSLTLFYCFQTSKWYYFIGQVSDLLAGLLKSNSKSTMDQFTFLITSAHLKAHMHGRFWLDIGQELSLAWMGLWLESSRWTLILLTQQMAYPARG